MQDFLTFRKMMTPIVIQIVFWVGACVCAVLGLVSLFAAIRMDSASGILLSLLWLVLGPVLVRIYCEIIILFFRIYDVLLEIRQNTARSPSGQP
jgi:hypothetical protein